MFIDELPRQVITQVLDAVRFEEWSGGAFFGCSGSFRLERVARRRHPELPIYASDATLLSCSVGALAMQREFPLTFVGALAWVEEALAGASFLEHAAAVWVVLEMAKYRGDNAYARSHWAHYRANFASYLESARENLRKLVAQLALTEVYQGDFRGQIERAREAGGGVVLSVLAGGYARDHRFLEANAEWPRPGAVELPRLAELLDSLDRLELPYAVVADQVPEGHKPAAAFYGSLTPLYTFASAPIASLRRRLSRAETFRYTLIEPEKIHEGSVCQVMPIDNAKLTFLKSVYLAKGINTVTGQAQWAVLLDGMLAGAFAFSMEKWGDRSSGIYLLTDFATTRERKLSKLIPMIASCREVIGQLDRKFIIRVQDIWTTAFSGNATSMKYRGVFEVHSRKPGQIQYRGKVLDLSAQEVFREWWKRWILGITAEQIRNQNRHRPRKARGAEAP